MSLFDELSEMAALICAERRALADKSGIPFTDRYDLGAAVYAAIRRECTPLPADPVNTFFGMMFVIDPTIPPNDMRCVNVRYNPETGKHEEEVVKVINIQLQERGGKQR